LYRAAAAVPPPAIFRKARLVSFVTLPQLPSRLISLADQ
jgi:hypothetical protein